MKWIIFPDKQRLRQFLASRSALQETLKKVRKEMIADSNLNSEEKKWRT